MSSTKLEKTVYTQSQFAATVDCTQNVVPLTFVM